MSDIDKDIEKILEDNPSITRNWLELRFKILCRDEFRCVYCGKTSKEASLHVDHLVPKSRGGLSNEDNLVTACEFCNAGKSDILISKQLMRLIANRYK